MKLPGASWTALIILLTGALGGWLTEYVNQPWAPLAVMALSLIAKAAEIYLSSTPTRVASEVFESAAEPRMERSVVSRLLFG